MKLAKKNGDGKSKLRMSKKEWVRLGQDAGWEIPDEILESDDVPADPKHKIEVRQYGEQDYWVFLDGELFAIVKHAIGEMD